MAKKLTVLTPDDADVLRELVRDWRGRKRSQVRSPGGLDDFPAPECYVAKTPAGGIPGLDDNTGGTGTGTGVHPGAADCQIWRIVDPASNDPWMEDVTGTERRVYNVSDSPIYGNVWIPVERDKMGFWLALGGFVSCCDQSECCDGGGGEPPDESNPCTETPCGDWTLNLCGPSVLGPNGGAYIGTLWQRVIPLTPGWQNVGGDCAPMLENIHVVCMEDGNPGYGWAPSGDFGNGILTTDYDELVAFITANSLAACPPAVPSKNILDASMLACCSALASRYPYLAYCCGDDGGPVPSPTPDPDPGQCPPDMYTHPQGNGQCCSQPWFYDQFLDEWVCRGHVSSGGGVEPFSDVNLRVWDNQLFATTGTEGDVLTLGSGRTVSPAASSGGSAPFSDSTALVKDAADATKLLRIEVGGIATGTTRVWTAPDSDGTIALAGINALQLKRKTADESATSDTTLSADNTLTVTVSANKTYAINIRMRIVDTGFPGGGEFKYRLTGPASPTRINRIIRQWTATALTEEITVRVDSFDSANRTVSPTSADVTFIEEEIHFENGANAGTVAVEWAQNASNVNAVTMKKGSHLTYAEF